MAVPLIVAGALAAGAATGAGIQLAKKVGNNAQGSTSFERTQGYDPNAALYGGQQGGLDQYGANMNARAQAADSRMAPQADYANANWDRQMAGQARVGQDQAAQMMLARAGGQVPSIAQMQADRQMQQATAAQASQAASARGAAGMALAQQNAANNTANAQSAISGQAQINAAQERLQAEQAAAGAYGQMRGGDLASQGQAAGQEQFQAQTELASRTANDQRAMGYEQLTNKAAADELQARTQNQATLAKSLDNSEALNQQRRQANAQNSRSLWDKLIPSDERAKDELPAYALQKGGGQGNGDSGIDPQKAMMLASSIGSMTSVTRAKAMVKGWNDQQWMANDPAGYARAMTPATSRAHPQAGSPADQADINFIKYGENASPEMLDDRADGGAAQDGMGKAALDQQIGQQVQQDAPTAQWERSFGSAEQAKNDVRESDNRAEAAKIRKGFELDKGGGQQPWYMTPVDGGMWSDARAKREAYIDGMENAQKTMDTGIAQPHPKYLIEGDAEMAGKKAGNDFDHSVGAKGQAVQDFAQTVMMPPVGLAHAAREAVTNPAYAETARGVASEVGRQVKRDFADPGHDFRPSPEHVRAPQKSGSVSGGVRESDAVAEANRSMAGSPYAYKPGMTPPEQQQGEPNFGPMAQNMERSPIAATAIKEDPTTGLKMVDKDKALKITMSGVADLQQQLDELKAGGGGAGGYPTLQEVADQQRKPIALGRGGKKK